MSNQTIPQTPDGRLAGDGFAGDEIRWRAVLDREPAADGAFYYAVRSTGIYCRPTCPARRPQRARVEFFDTSQAAERAGFRPCRRCRPDEVSARQQVIARIQDLLDGSEATPSLEALGAAVGMSPSHLQRTFKRATGLSPRQYAAARRAERLKAGLRNGASVTTALYDAGYGSSRSLYEQAPTQLGMRPAAYKHGGRGERIAYAVSDSTLGRLLVAATEKGLCALRFGDAGADDALLAELRAEFPQAALAHDPAAVESYVRAALDHLAGRQPSLELPVDAKATGFQQRVWAALRQIPYGQTRSYSQVAAMIGAPSAVRAVARACATNPVALVVPCHRVVGANGRLSGYRWGLARKRALLDQERTLPAPA